MDYILDLFTQNKCVYCKKELEKELWKSTWEQEHHYKMLGCSCGKKNWVRMSFQGSGHDYLFRKDINSIESTVRKVREG